MHVSTSSAPRVGLRLGLAAIVAAVALTAGDAQGAVPQEAPLAEGPSERLTEAGRLRLARVLTRTSLDLLRLPEPTATDYEVALTLSEWSTELVPDWLDGWRVYLQIASVAESVDDRGAERLRNALSAIVRLDPRDEVARLRLLSLAVDRYGTVEERVAAYERLLAPENLSRLGGPVASRLALELALLLYRNGDVEGFASRLAESVALDPAHPAATEMAAGFLRHRVNDAVGEAELALTAAVANPANLDPLQTLAKLCLSNGAFAAAQRLYGIVLPLMQVQRQSMAEASAGLALSEWALGAAPTAVAIIDKRQRDLDQLARAEARLQDPDFDWSQAEGIRVPPNRQLSTLKAIILRSVDSPDADAAVGEALLAMRMEADQIARGGNSMETSRGIAELALESVSMLLWLGADVENAVGMYEQLMESARIGSAASARIEGWIALRRGDAAKAIELLEPLVAVDAVSSIGLAQAYLDLDRRGDAARQFLEIWRKQPGSALGVWSRDRLATLLGRPVPPSETAESLEALVRGLPRTYDRLLSDRERAVGLMVRPRKPSVGPLEPVEVDVEITNLTDLPLAISSAGPIDPNLAIIANATVSQLDRAVASQPLVVPISGVLRLGPRERLVVPVDLSLTAFGDVLDRTALSGSTLGCRALTNFRPVSGGALQPGPLGAKAEGSQIRVDGVRVSAGWVEDALAAIATPDGDADLVFMNLLAAVGAATDNAPEAPPEEFEALLRIWPVMQGAWEKLDPASRGWLLATFPTVPSKGIAELVDRARASRDPLTVLGYLLGRVRSADDPILLEAIASDDPRLELVGDLVRSRLLEAASRQDPPPRRPGS
jgi:tetratricopeptide (TPR) repeat protein